LFSFQAATLADYQAKVAEAGDRLVVVDCFATWCPPCRMMAPIFEKLSEEFTDAVFIKVDSDANKAVAQMLNVTSLPSFFLFKGGKEVGRQVGANPAGLKQLIQSRL
jgi:thioredoxin 1